MTAWKKNERNVWCNLFLLRNLFIIETNSKSRLILFIESWLQLLVKLLNAYNLKLNKQWRWKCLIVIQFTNCLLEWRFTLRHGSEMKTDGSKRACAIAFAWTLINKKQYRNLLNSFFTIRKLFVLIDVQIIGSHWIHSQNKKFVHYSLFLKYTQFCQACKSILQCFSNMQF